MSNPTTILNQEQLAELLAGMTTNDGSSLNEHLAKKPIMLVFLRSFGCTFCREALMDISKRRKEIEKLGSKLVFVHMASFEEGNTYLNKYKLNNATHVSDPECRFYAAFGLVKGSVNQLFGLSTWIRGFGEGGFQRGFSLAQQLGDAFQMPGIFMLQDGEIRTSFTHYYVSDRPNYVQMAECCIIPEVTQM
jgi:peroxiredoxin